MGGWLQPDQQFRERLFIGYGYACLVARRLQAAGVQASVPALDIALSHREIPRFRQEVDVLVGGAAIEVKSHRAYSYTDDPADFPFRWAVIDTVVGWDRKEASGKPILAAVLVSQPTAGMVVVPISTRAEWQVHTRTDRNLDLTEDYYEVARERLEPFDVLACWLRLEEAVRERDADDLVAGWSDW